MKILEYKLLPCLGSIGGRLRIECRPQLTSAAECGVRATRWRLPKKREDVHDISCCVLGESRTGYLVVTRHIIARRMSTPTSAPSSHGASSPGGSDSAMGGERDVHKRKRTYGRTRSANLTCELVIFFYDRRFACSTHALQSLHRLAFHK